MRKIEDTEIPGFGNIQLKKMTLLLAFMKPI